MKKHVVVAALLGGLALLVAYSGCESRGDFARASERQERGRGWIGVYLQDLTPELKKGLDVKVDEGAVITRVVEDSPAEEAGLEEEDVIVKVNGQPVRDAGDVTRAVRRATPGDTLQFEVVRDGKQQTIQVEVEARPPRESFPGVVTIYPFRRPWLGVHLQELNPDLGEYFNTREGVLITEVEENSPAEKAGLKAGDVILEIEGKKVKDAEDLHDRIADFKRGDTVKITILRKGQRMDVTATLGRAPRSELYFPPGRWKFGPGHFYFDFGERWREHLRDQLWQGRRQLEREMGRLREQMEKLKDEFKDLKEKVT